MPVSSATAPCLLVNPRSFSASRAGLARQAAALARAQGIEVIRAADATEISAAVDLFLDRRQRTVFILSGDGTVQAVADRLVSLPAEVPRPQLLVLGGGRSNVTAGELGGRGDVLSKLETALRRWRDDAVLGVEVRHVLRVEQPPAPARHGFFLAAGLIDHAIRACHRHRENGTGTLRGGAAGTAWSLLKLATPVVLGARELPLDELEVEVPGHEAPAKPVRLLIATTLQKRQGFFDPFAERGLGTVRFTGVAARGMSFWARLPWLATGRFTPSMDAGRGYMSGRCDSLLVHKLSTYTLDGEEFEADPARPIAIRRGPPLTFLTL